VADHGEARLARRRTAERPAVLRRKLAPGRAQREIDDELGRVRQAIADFHDRQRTQAVRDGDAEDRRALEYAYRFDRRLAVAAVDVAQHAREQGLELLARGRRIEDAGVEQLVEQQRVFRKLA